jgi:SAM-dependent methyltransferase
MNCYRTCIALVFFLAITSSGYSAQKDAQKWDKNYEKPGYRYGLKELPVLDRWSELLISKAKGGRALDIASGEGQNSIKLAKYGYTVDCVDISKVGLSKCRTLARTFGVEKKINTICADLDTYRFEEDSYSCIINMRFLMRSLTPQIVKALKPGGILIYETFTKDDGKAQMEGANKDYFLDRNELLKMFPDLMVLFYHERMVDGRAVATLIARKPGPAVGLEYANPETLAGSSTSSGKCCETYKYRAE